MGRVLTKGGFHADDHQTAPDRVDITLSDKLDAHMLCTALDDLIEKSEGVTNGVKRYRITDLAMPDLGAFGVEFARLPYTARKAALSMDQTLQ